MRSRSSCQRCAPATARTPGIWRSVNTVSGNDLVWAFYLSFSRRHIPFCAASRREPDVSSGWALPVVKRGRGRARRGGMCAWRDIALRLDRPFGRLYCGRRDNVSQTASKTESKSHPKFQKIPATKIERFLIQKRCTNFAPKIPAQFQKENSTPPPSDSASKNVVLILRPISTSNSKKKILPPRRVIRPPKTLY